jgi:hypothetical protein
MVDVAIASCQSIGGGLLLSTSNSSARTLRSKPSNFFASSNANRQPLELAFDIL